MSYQLIEASAHETGLADESVHCVVTSPPYFGLRSYHGEQDVEWPEVSYSPMPGLPTITVSGCAPGCKHEWAGESTKSQSLQTAYVTGRASGNAFAPGKKLASSSHVLSNQICTHCGGMRCGLGAEKTAEAFIGHLILVMREMKRILRKDGLAAINLGDSYNGSGGAGGDYNEGGSKAGQPKFSGVKLSTLRPKNMLMIPARFALACQADGWIVRSDMPWIKRNSMPESVQDRPANATEHVFLLAKSERYFFDMESVKQPVTGGSHGGTINEGGKKQAALGQQKNGRLGNEPTSGTRSLRNTDFFFKTWQGMASGDDSEPLALVVNPKGWSSSGQTDHFACWPEFMAETLIRCSTSAYGVCGKCGSPYVRMVERTSMVINKTKRNTDRGTRTGTSGTMVSPASATTTGWQPSCNCVDAEIIPATVCDPFIGSGTTARAAMALGRDAIGIDVCKEYLSELVPSRTGNVQIELLAVNV